MKVASVLSGKTSLAAHGSQEMPVWGPVFWRMSQGHPVEVQLRIANLQRVHQVAAGQVKLPAGICATSLRAGCSCFPSNGAGRFS